MPVIALARIQISPATLLHPPSGIKTIPGRPGLYGRMGVSQYARPAAEYLLGGFGACLVRPAMRSSLGRWRCGPASEPMAVPHRRRFGWRSVAVGVAARVGPNRALQRTPATAVVGGSRGVPAGRVR